MKIFSVHTVREWDAYTIANEPIESINLMERASKAVVDWIIIAQTVKKVVSVFCGPGNNGGDGLAVARLLTIEGFHVKVYLLASANTSPDFDIGLTRLDEMDIEVKVLANPSDYPGIEPDELVIDALFGSGLSRLLDGNAAELVAYINSLVVEVISIDLPSGLHADGLADGAVIQAGTTLSFQCPKLCFFFAENDPFVGKWHVLDIGLHPGFPPFQQSANIWVDIAFASAIRPEARGIHSHKGNFGHSMMLAGSAGMMGAAIMSASACLRSGTGLLTMGVPESYFSTMHIAVPEAMCVPDTHLMDHALFEKKSAVSAGPGWPVDDYHAHLLQWLLSNVGMPLLLDASSLTLLSQNLSLLELRPAGAPLIITPHIGEFHRLFGHCSNSMQRLSLAKEMARRYNVFIVLKGAWTQIITPGGLVYFNSTGNPGMAKGGSGDVLAGFITGLLAQKISPALACILGVYLHGLAGDFAAAAHSQQGMTAMDICSHLPDAWKLLMQQHAD